MLESVVALSIISVCLYIAIIIYAAIFTPKTSARFYYSFNKTNEVFFAMQLAQDSVSERYDTDNWEITDETQGGVKKITANYKDSLQSYPQKSFYIPNE
ncbi:hypothetical protein [Flavobacterium sp. NRK1]|uniref:hypothetical protein n=1 Tax=Flavobacterium sp. NRK1 TaxID=2954929 RepID=UPI0020928C76|nr:hypothetical protein [Flavobacterium sp. NRK1]MCO6147922.1 hypothetical protein [Flavobacterium sp. NRK1]